MRSESEDYFYQLRRRWMNCRCVLAGRVSKKKKANFHPQL